MEWSSPSSAKDPGCVGLFPAAPLMVECKVCPSSGSSLLTQAWRWRGKAKAGHQCGASTKLRTSDSRIGVEIMRTIFLFSCSGFLNMIGYR